MALRIFTRMMTKPAQTGLFAVTDGLAGKGNSMIFMPRNAPDPVVRQMAISAASRDKAPDETGTDMVRKESKAPVSKRSSGLGGLSRRRHDAFLDIWDPFFPNRSLKQMLDTVDRLFDNSFFGALASPVLSASLRTPWDIMEDEDAFRLRFDMPGLSKEEVKVAVEDGDLVIKGEHKTEEQSENSWTSRGYGSYSTRMTLPSHVKIDELKAELKDGVLHVVVPKFKEETKKKIIDINVN